MVAHRFVGGRGRARVAGGVGVSGGRGRPVLPRARVGCGFGRCQGRRSVRAGGGRGRGRAACARSVVFLPGPLPAAAGPALRAFAALGGRVVPGAGASLPAAGRRSRRADRHIDEPLTSGLLSPCLAPGQAPGGSA